MILAFAAAVCCLLGCAESPGARSRGDAPVPTATSSRNAARPLRPRLAPDASVGLDNLRERSSAAAWTEQLVLNAAAFASEGGPSVVVHAPAHFDSTPPLQLVVFLHGWTGCAVVLEATGDVRCRPGDQQSVLRPGWGLGERHDEAGTNSLLVVPQLGWLVQDGDPGRFASAGGFRDFLVELLRTLSVRIGRGRSLADVGRVTLVAHSAGYEAALAIAQRGEIDETLRDIVLFDALYAAPALFGQWVLDGPTDGERRRLVTLHGGRGRTARFSTRLGRSLQARLGRQRVALEPRSSLSEAIRDHQVVVARTRAPHALVPARHLAEVLSSLGLPRREDL